MARLLPRLHRARRATRGSVILIVMITLLFASFALLAFIERAANDLLVDQREAEARRLRVEAYSALEVTLAVLEDFRLASDGLHSPAEGWADPLAFAGYTPANDRKVDVAFEDESGKISLPHATPLVMSRLFQQWGFTQNESDDLADALQGWMKRDHLYRTAISPDYESGSLPYEVPGRPLRTYTELAAIALFREKFYDADGRPNDHWRRFVDNVSLLNFPRSNLNGAKPDALAALGQFQESSQRHLADYLGGTGTYQSSGPGFFRNVAEAQRLTGPEGNAGAFGSTVAALRINLTVHDGRSQFRLSAVVSPPGGGATTVQATATSTRTKTPAGAKAAPPKPTVTPAPNPAASAQKSPASTDLKYPFTLLEIRENDEIPPVPAPPPPPN
ncbi:MAG: hypothetical protein RLZZ15_1542 [Verrucomicrobiota bacterium]